MHDIVAASEQRLELDSWAAFTVFVVCMISLGLVGKIIGTPYHLATTCIWQHNIYAGRGKCE